MIGRCHIEVESPSNEVDKLVKEKISLINRATDILYNVRTPEGRDKLKEIESAETELEKKIDALPDRSVIDNNSELKEAINRLERAKEDIESGL